MQSLLYLAPAFPGAMAPAELSGAKRFGNALVGLGRRRRLHEEVAGSNNLEGAAAVLEQVLKALSLEEFHDWRPKENAFGGSFRNYGDSKR